jgi:hypothetical protein
VSRTWALMQRVDAPDVENPDENYMVRWRLVQTPWFGVYIHRINTPDRRSTLHDHPWPFVTVVLRGGYVEDYGETTTGKYHSYTYQCGSRTWRACSVHVMRKTDAHTITELRRSPTWTLVFAGLRKPEPSWGYWDEDGFTPYDEHPEADEFAAAVEARDAGDER